MQKLLLNDDAQAAQQLGFDGVHLGQDDLQLQSGFLPASPAADFIWGISVHNPQEADVALSYHPTYIALGPLFPSTNKPALPCQGVEPLSNLLNQLRHRFGGPIVAIGGIQSQNYQHAFNLGFDGVAFIHWNEQIIASASTPQQLAQKIENAVIQNN
jgi:thiamine-phosphate pyrophosphorylase